MLKYCIVFICYFLFLLFAYSQKPHKPISKPINTKVTTTKPEPIVVLPQDTIWKKLDNGLSFAEFDAPIKSIVGDSKMQVIRINPKYYRFGISMASASRCRPKTIEAWCKLDKYSVAINAGMFSLKNCRTAAGYMKYYKKVNNPVYKESYSALCVFNKVKGANVPEFDILDMQDSTWKQKKNSYNSMFQSIRMIDENGKPIIWKANPDQRSSIVTLGVDSLGNVLFIFARSPYSANEFTTMMLKLPLHLRTAMYLEGGPEASLYAKTSAFTLRKYGSYVSRTNENDINARFWELPNILGATKKPAAVKKAKKKK